MAKMTLEQLRALRAEQQTELSNRETEGKTVQIIVGMGTCGIAAGAKDALDVFLNEIKGRGLKNVMVRQTGCMGLCYGEPTVEVKVPGMPDTIYGNVDGKVAKEIVEMHIEQKHLVNNHIFDRPAGDILKK